MQKSLSSLFVIHPVSLREILASALCLDTHINTHTHTNTQRWRHIWQETKTTVCRDCSNTDDSVSIEAAGSARPLTPSPSHVLTFIRVRYCKEQGAVCTVTLVISLQSHFVRTSDCLSSGFFSCWHCTVDSNFGLVVRMYMTGWWKLRQLVSKLSSIFVNVWNRIKLFISLKLIS